MSKTLTRELLNKRVEVLTQSGPVHGILKCYDDVFMQLERCTICGRDYGKAMVPIREFESLIPCSAVD